MQKEPQRETGQLVRGQPGVPREQSQSSAGALNHYSMRLFVSFLLFMDIPHILLFTIFFPDHTSQRSTPILISFIPCALYPAANPMKNHYVGNPEFEGKS